MSKHSTGYFAIREFLEFRYKFSRSVVPDAQSYLFRTICQPTLCYGTEIMNISHRDVAQLDSTQRQLIKRSLGLSMNIKRARDLVGMHALYSDGYILPLVLPEIYISTIFHAIYSLAMYVKAPC